MSDVADATDIADDHHGKETTGLQTADAALLDQLRNQEDPGDGDWPALTISRIDFAGADLTGIALRGISFSEVNFDSANLAGARFIECGIAGSSFKGANLRAAVFPNSDLSDIDFTGANLEEASFADGTIENTDLSGANLTRAVFDNGAVGIDFLAAESVEGLAVWEVEDIPFRDILLLQERGADAHWGIRCPRCARIDWHDDGKVDPDCNVCEGSGWIDEDRKDDFVVECPWCQGAGQVIYSIAGEGRCLACEETGMVGVWVIDRERHNANLPWEYEEYKTDDDDLGSMTISDTNLANLSFKHALVKDTAFHNCSLQGTNFSGSRLKFVNFVDCDLSEVDFSQTFMDVVHFSDCLMTRTIWTGGRMQRTTAVRCDLTDATISRNRLGKLQQETVSN